MTVGDARALIDDGRPWPEINADHPDLQSEDLRAALAYAGAHLPGYIPQTMPLQITRRLMNVDDIVAWADRVGFTPLRLRPELHVTLVYSGYDIAPEDSPWSRPRGARLRRSSDRLRPFATRRWS